MTPPPPQQGPSGSKVLTSHPTTTQGTGVPNLYEVTVRCEDGSTGVAVWADGAWQWTGASGGKVDVEPKKWRANYVAAPHFYNLNQACRIVNDAFAFGEHFGCYLVGSSLDRRDYRDVDVRLIMKDEAYDALFRDGRGENGGGWLNPLWSLLCTSISLWLSQQSGLPIDFQIQRMTQANELHGRKQGCKRSALGLFLDYPGERPTDVAATPKDGGA